MRKAAAFLLALLTATHVVAEDFGSRFKDGYGKLREGDPEAALASFQNLLTETPDSELVRYSIAAAEYALGVRALDSGDTEAGGEALAHARSQFDELRAAQTPFVRRESGFSSANAVAQIGLHLDDSSAYKERLEALQSAVQSYETFLDEYPDHEGAATNLNHTSYLLKKMLQNPPEDQQKSDDPGEGENNEPNQQGDQGQQPQEDQGEPEDQEPSEDNASGENSDANKPQDQASDGEKTDDENIEAILQSLEDTNQQEQKNLRRAKEPPKVVGGKWW